MRTSDKYVKGLTIEERSDWLEVTVAGYLPLNESWERSRTETKDIEPVIGRENADSEIYQMFSKIGYYNQFFLVCCCK